MTRAQTSPAAAAAVHALRGPGRDAGRRRVADRRAARRHDRRHAPGSARCSGAGSSSTPPISRPAWPACRQTCWPSAGRSTRTWRVALADGRPAALRRRLGRWPPPGVAGPEPQDGKPVGPGLRGASPGRPGRPCGELGLDGGRAAVRAGGRVTAPCDSLVGDAASPRGGQSPAVRTGPVSTASRRAKRTSARRGPSRDPAGRDVAWPAAGTVAGSLRRHVGGAARRGRCEWSCYAG